MHVKYFLFDPLKLFFAFYHLALWGTIAKLSIPPSGFPDEVNHGRSQRRLEIGRERERDRCLFPAPFPVILSLIVAVFPHKGQKILWVNHLRDGFP